MSMQPDGVDDERVQRLLARLSAARQEVDAQPEPERRAHLRRLLDEELAAVPEDVAARVLDRARDRLVEDARTREERLAAATSELEQLRAAVGDAHRTSERLGEENAALRDEVRALRSRTVAQDGTAGSAGAAQIAAALRAYATGAPPDGPLPPDAQLIVNTMSELFTFACNIANGVNTYQASLMNRFGTAVLRDHAQLMKKRFAACLEGTPGSVDALRKLLEPTSRFLLHLARSWELASVQGARQILDELDPAPIAAEHKGLVGTNWDQAWKKLAKRHEDMSRLPNDDFKEQYFGGHLKQELEKLLSANEGG